MYKYTVAIFVHKKKTVTLLMSFIYDYWLWSQKYNTFIFQSLLEVKYVWKTITWFNGSTEGRANQYPMIFVVNFNLFVRVFKMRSKDIQIYQVCDGLLNCDMYSILINLICLNLALVILKVNLNSINSIHL